MEQEFTIEKRSQLMCVSCKKIPKHCKCKTPDHKMIETEYKVAIEVGQNSDGSGQRHFDSEEDRLQSIARRFAEKEEKRKQRLHLSEEMTMDPEELAEKKLGEEMSKRQVVKVIENEAKDFVDQIDAEKARLEAEGKTPREIMKAIKELKRELRGASISAESASSLPSEPASEPAADESSNFTMDDLDDEGDDEGTEQISAPVKDAVTGKIVEASGANSLGEASVKRGGRPAGSKNTKTQE